MQKARAMLLRMQVVQGATFLVALVLAVGEKPLGQVYHHLMKMMRMTMMILPQRVASQY